MQAPRDVYLLPITSNNFLVSLFSALYYQSNVLVSTCGFLQRICFLCSLWCLEIVTDSCEPCPSNGECNDGKLECLRGYRKQGNLCVEDGDINESARKIVCPSVWFIILLILKNKSYLLFFSLAFLAFYFDHSDWFYFFVCVWWFDHRWREWNITSVKNMLNICALELDQFGLVFFSLLTPELCSSLVFIVLWLYFLLLEFFCYWFQLPILYSHLRFMTTICGILLSHWGMTKWTMHFITIQSKRHLIQWVNYWIWD